MFGREVPGCLAAAAFLLSPGLAAAQEAALPAASPPAEARPREVVVTGSRLPRERGVTVSPVHVIGRDELLASGAITLADVLRGLPAQGNAAHAGFVSGHGSTRASLRGLGAERTLVLVNGRRWVPGGATGAGGAVDLESIPMAAVERIEVLMDGGSAVYGSDAIAGVVNLVTRDAEQARDLSVLAGTSQAGGGTTYDVSATVGTAGERAGLLLSAGFRRRERALARDRDWSAMPVALDATTGQELPLLSSTTPAGRFLLGNGVAWGGFGVLPDPLAPGTRGVSDPSASALYNDLVAACPTANVPYTVITQPDGSTALGPAAGTRLACPDSYVWDPAASGAYGGLGWRAWRGTAPPEAGGDGYDHLEEYDLVAPSERVELSAAGNASVGAAARAFLEASYVKRRSSQGLASEALTTEAYGVVVSGDSVYNPFGRDLSVRRRLVELGRHTTRQDLDTVRVVVGLDGAAPEGLGPFADFAWDVSASYGRSGGTQTKEGYLYPPALQDALGPSFVRLDGTPGCGTSAGMELPGCVPLDLFHGPGSITPDQLAAVSRDTRTRVVDRSISVQANARGAPFSLPVAGRPVRVAVGAEWRELAGERRADPLAEAGLVTSGIETSADGRYDVTEAYAEASLPLASRLPLADDLEATLAARLVHYGTFGADWTYALGARWRPLPGVTIRGMFSTAFRAPTIEESFRGQQEIYHSVSDPCASPASAAIAARCGAAAWNGDDQSMLLTRIGGNPDLGPETARVLTAGVVLEPQGLPGLSAAVGYHDVEIDGIVGSHGAALLLRGCYGGTNPEYCSHVVRDPATHYIESIYDLDANAGKVATSGLDVGLRWAVPTTRAGRFTFALDATWLRRLDWTLPDGTVVEGKGTYDLDALEGAEGAGAAFPAWRANAGVAWARGRLAVGLSSRFLGSFRECASPYGDLFDGTGSCYEDDRNQRNVDAYHAEDAFLSWAFRSRAGTTRITAAVQNLLDRDPPRIYGGSPYQTDPYAYDLVGRFFHVRLAHAY